MGGNDNQKNGGGVLNWADARESRRTEHTKKHTAPNTKGGTPSNGRREVRGFNGRQKTRRTNGPKWGGGQEKKRGGKEHSAGPKYNLQGVVGRKWGRKTGVQRGVTWPRWLGCVRGGTCINGKKGNAEGNRQNQWNENHDENDGGVTQTTIGNFLNIESRNRAISQVNRRSASCSSDDAHVGVIKEKR